MIKTLNPEIQAIFKKAEEDVTAAIRDRADLSYQAIAQMCSVSIAFINTCAYKLRQETGFARLPRKVKHV
jgi:hypothetical protein